MEKSRYRYARLTKDKKIVGTNDVLNVEKSMSQKDKIIKQESYKGYFVSTVFIPIDLSFGEGEPVHFETMIFPADKRGGIRDFLEKWCERTTTYEKALEVHEKAKEVIDKGDF